MRLAWRPGFTLVEVLVAASIGTVLMVMVTQAYLGMGNSQALATLGLNLKNCGTASISEIHKSLRAAHLILAKPVPLNDPTHTTNAWLGRVPVAGLHEAGAVKAPIGYSTDTSELTPGPFRGDGARPDEFLLPGISQSASFYEADVDGAANPDFSASDVGNALAFFVNEPKVKITMKLNTGENPAAALAAFGGSEVQRFSAYRLVVFYVARRPLPVGISLRRAAVTDADYTYTLMQWKSRPFVDREEVESWMRRLDAGWATLDPKLADGGGGVELYVLNKMVELKNQGMVGSIIPSAKNPARAEIPNAVGSLLPSRGPSATGPLQSADEDCDLLTGDFRTALRLLPRDSSGEGMLAFNSRAGGPYDPVDMGGLRVPSFGVTTGVPFGFEVAVGGLRTNRQVMVRLNLAARTLSARKYVGQVFQQVVSVAED